MMRRIMQALGVDKRTSAEPAQQQENVQSNAHYKNLDLTGMSEYDVSILLLQQFTLIDNPDRNDLSVELQQLIKDRLLDLPETCMELDWYYKFYNSYDRSGPVANSYQVEVFGILKRAIPEISKMFLDGTKFGFIPAAAQPQGADHSEVPALKM